MNPDAALLYSDLVESTRLGQQLGDAAMNALWVRHDRLARDLARQCGGLEIGRSDGFLLLFPDVVSALAFAQGYHALAESLHPDLRARVGVHHGPVRLRLNDAQDTAWGASRHEVDGAALPMVARVMAVARPGQTLLTEDARTQLAAIAPDILPHGFWMFRGLSEPVGLFEADRPGAPRLPPADGPKGHAVVRDVAGWRARRDIPHQLPGEHDAFVGRQAVLDAMTRALDDGARCVTLVGPGGGGKTRIATRYARLWLGSFAGGAWFCDCVSARDVDSLVQTVARSLGLILSGDAVGQRLELAMASLGEALIVIDNVEQLDAAAEALLSRWVDVCAPARFMFTSRRPLPLVGGPRVELAPLSSWEAAELFHQRALAVSMNYRADSVHEDVLQLTAVLDGLPLAIELAASRVRLMPPAQLLKRIGERFHWLKNAGAPVGRHATLFATIEWSWHLLATAEQLALARLSVFEGSFDSAAAEAVVGTAEDSGAWVLERVQALLDHSLVNSGDNARLSLPLSVREFAAGQLHDDGAAADRHARWYAARSVAETEATAVPDLANLVAACRHAAAKGDTQLAADALHACWVALRLTGPYAQALDLADAVARLEIATAAQAIVDHVAGSALCLLGRHADAEGRLTMAVAAAQATGQAALLGRTLCALAENRMATAHLDSADEALDAAEGLLAGSPDLALRHMVFNGRGAVAVQRGRMDDARLLFEQALLAADAHGDQRWRGALLGNLGVVTLATGHLEAAERLLEEALRTSTRTGDRRWRGNAACNLAMLLFERGEHAAARDRLEAALVESRLLGHAQLEATVLCNLGLVHESLGDLQTAVGQLQASVALAGRLGDKCSEGLFAAYLGRVFGRLGRQREAQAALQQAAAGVAAGQDHHAQGLVEAFRVEAALAAGDTAGARAALAAAQASLQACGTGPDSELGRALARATQALAHAGLTGPD